MRVRVVPIIIGVITVQYYCGVRIRIRYRLTDEETRARWEAFGDPDGPSDMESQIIAVAVPIWLVDGLNSPWIVATAIGLVLLLIPGLLALAISFFKRSS